MAQQRILVVAGLALLLGAAGHGVFGAGTEAGGSNGSDGQRPTDSMSPLGHAAVVVSMYQGYVSSVGITLPAGESEDEARQALQGIAKYTGWQFDNPVVKQDGYTSAQANALGMVTLSLDGLQPVAPLVMALADHQRIAVVFIGVGRAGDGGGRFENRHTVADWLQSGGVRSYQITIKDRSFRNVAELTAPEPPQPPARGSGSGQLWLWALLVIGSAAVGTFCYLLARYLMKRRG